MITGQIGPGDKRGRPFGRGAIRSLLSKKNNIERNEDGWETKTIARTSKFWVYISKNDRLGIKPRLTFRKCGSSYLYIRLDGDEVEDFKACLRAILEELE